MQTFTLNDLPQRILLDLWNKFAENYKFLYENVSMLRRITSLFPTRNNKKRCRVKFNLIWTEKTSRDEVKISTESRIF